MSTIEGMLTDDIDLNFNSWDCYYGPGGDMFLTIYNKDITGTAHMPSTIKVCGAGGGGNYPPEIKNALANLIQIVDKYRNELKNGRHNGF